jgi:hypothetical protein
MRSLPSYGWEKFTSAAKASEQVLLNAALSGYLHSSHAK